MPKELGKLPKGGVTVRPDYAVRVSETPKIAGPAGATPKGVVAGAEPIRTAPGSNKKPR